MIGAVKYSLLVEYVASIVICGWTRVRWDKWVIEVDEWIEIWYVKCVKWIRYVVVEM